MAQGITHTPLSQSWQVTLPPSSDTERDGSTALFLIGTIASLAFVLLSAVYALRFPASARSNAAPPTPLPLIFPATVEEICTHMTQTGSMSKMFKQELTIFVSAKNFRTIKNTPGDRKFEIIEKILRGQLFQYGYKADLIPPSSRAEFFFKARQDLSGGWGIIALQCKWNGSLVDFTLKLNKMAS